MKRRKSIKRIVSIILTVCMMLTSTLFVSAATNDVAPRGIEKVQYYYDYVDIGAGQQLKLGCSIMVGCGQSCSWNYVVDSFCDPISSGYDFSYNAQSINASMPANKSYVYVSSTGVAEVRVSTSVGASAKAEFLGAGFDLSGTVSGDWVFRKDVNISRTFYQ